MNDVLVRPVLAVALLTLASPAALRAAEPAYAFPDAHQFLARFCVECHGPEKPQAKLNLQRFENPQQLLAARKVWDEVLLRVRNGEMPPRSPKRTPPPEDARQAFVRWVEQTLRQVACHDAGPGPAPIRRLNKTLYRATIRDL